MAEIKNKIADAMGDLAELVILRTPPFENLPVHEEICGLLYNKYLEYEKLIDKELAQKYIEGAILYAKFSFKKGLVGLTEKFSVICPEYMKVKEDLLSWIRVHENRFFFEDSSPFGGTWKTNVRQIAKNVMGNRMPKFIYQRNKKFPGEICFGKALYESNKICILVGRSSKSFFLDFYIGMEDPTFSFDIASLYANSQSCFWYQSESEVERNMHKAIDFLEVFLPPFTEKMNEVFKDYKR